MKRRCAHSAAAQSSAAPERDFTAPETPQPCSDIRRYSHPIEQRCRRIQCEPLQSVLCALAGQNQVLCAMKAELDEILARLEDRDSSDCRTQ